MSLASLAAIALLSTAAAADTSVEKPAPATHVTAVAWSEQAGAGSASAPGTGEATAQCSPVRSSDSNTAVIEARPSTPGEEGIWSATP
jgi:hypothetical protein